MKIKKIMTLVLCAATVFSCAACNSDKTSSTQSATLKYVMPGPGKQADADMVWEAFNEKLHEKLPNVTVEFEVIPLADYSQKFMLAQTAGEKIDIANTYLLNFPIEVRNGTFLQLDDLYKKYGKGIAASIPSWAIDYGRVDGKLYQIPTYQMLMLPYSIRTQAEYADKWLDKEALKDAIENRENSLFPQKAYDVLEDYMQKLKENGKIQYGFDTGFNGFVSGYDMITDRYAIRQDDGKCKVVYVYDTTEYKETLSRLADWYKKGYIRKDSLSATDNDQIRGRMDGMTVWSGQTEPNYEKKSAESGKNIYEQWIDTDYYIPMINEAAGTGIFANTKYPDQAMQFLDLIQSDKELYNMLVFGIEGTHYTKVGENEITTISKKMPVSSDKYGLYSWIVGNTSLRYDWDVQTKEYNDWCFNTINKSKNRSKLIGFVPELSNLQTKLAQIKSLKTEYMSSLVSGSLPNWEERYNEWMNKIDIAGNKEIIAELQKQVDEFLKK